MYCIYFLLSNFHAIFFPLDVKENDDNKLATKKNLSSFSSKEKNCARKNKKWWVLVDILSLSLYIFILFASKATHSFHLTQSY